MDIKILGSGCKNCNILEKHTKDALEKLGISEEVTKVTETAEIMALGVMRTPTLIVDGKVEVLGRVAKTKELIKILSK